MTKTQTLVLIILGLAMMGVALSLGNWSASVNPDGIEPHPAAESATVEEVEAPQDAFSFGVSIGLLGMSLLYGCVAFGLFIQSRSKTKPPGMFIYYLAGLAGIGFALSYVVDDYFY